MNRARIIIVGGGFAAVKCARTLRKRLSRDECQIVIYSRENHMVFHPLLADVAGGSLHADAAATTIRQMLPGVECRTETVSRIDPAAQEIEFENEQGKLEQTKFDHLVIACGAESNLGIIPGMSDHAFAFKTMEDAVSLRSHIVEQLEKAEASADPERRKFLLSFAIIGAGFSGVELAGEVNDLVTESARFYKNFKEEEISVTVVHSTAQVLPEVSPSLRDFTLRKMQRHGVKILLNTRAVAATPEGVGLKDGSMIRAATIVCTIGTTPSALVNGLQVPKEHGRIVTDADMRVAGCPNVWAIGDCASISNAFDNQPSPPTAQFAERQGRQAADNIVRVLRAQPTRPFYFKPMGQLCSIGGRRAVAEMFGIRISGLLAWCMWRSVYLLKLPSWSRRFKVGLDWFWDLIFPRDLGLLRTDQVRATTRAYYRAGDFIYRQGEPADHFYLIEEGEAEILQTTAGDGEERLFGLLGAGDFCGDAALLGDASYLATIRARTALRVLTIDRSTFSKLSGAVAPLREFIASAVKRSSESPWLHYPAAKDALTKEPLSTFIEPPPSLTLNPSSTIEEAVAILKDSGMKFVVVLDDQKQLYGVLNAADVVGAVQLYAFLRGSGRRDVRKVQLREVVRSELVMVSAEESTLAAASLMHERKLRWIPVVDSMSGRHLEGFVQLEKINYWLLQELG